MTTTTGKGMHAFVRTDVVRQVAALALGMVAVAGLTGCPGTDEPPQRCQGAECADTGGNGGDEGCDEHSDCEIGEQCINNSCEAATGCDRDSQCPGDEVCRAGQCYASEPDTGVEDDSGPVDAVDGGGDAGDTGVAGDGTDAEPSDGTDGSCSGCIVETDAGPECVEETDRVACGTGGEACKQCGEYEQCKNGTCQERPCSPQNCDGCCLNGECKDGTASTACGKGGETCSECAGDTRCTPARQCESCNGCWTGDNECKSGDTSDFCGSNGEACTSCGSDEKCEGGKCIEKSCSETCSGCCDGSQCLNGDRDQACGTAGESCKQCGDGYECQGGGFSPNSCELDSSSRWDVLAVSADVPSKDHLNSSFDDSNGSDPDPYVQVIVNGSSETKRGKTGHKTDDKTPFWHGTTAKDVRAADLKRNNKTVFKIMDFDPWYNPDGDDKIVECKTNFKDQHFGSSVTWTCTNHQNSNNPVKATIKFRLKHHP